ncbi:MAG: 23S rRNA (adenine(2503)-C(2))-methyltransferase RlmN [Bdellovibrionales bacterium]|nr:23S rRNA (adenine(2503)-C(2))-methyltransferase RlmN [Bdellovibrionales bacterium]
MESILALTFDEFKDRIVDLLVPRYRAAQIYEWIFQRGATTFDEMTNLPVAFRQELSKLYKFPKLEVSHLNSLDGTKKFQFMLEDGHIIESVWMPEEKRNTLCVSSQVGCAMKCAFCVTGAIGFKRNLTAEEIAMQVWAIKCVEKLPLTNVVYMGMGEPLLNIDHVVRSIELLTDKIGIAVGKRRITVSTVGIVPKIREFVAKTDVKLAVSLTGTNNIDRDHWMPINKSHNLEKLTSELKSIPWAEGRKITFEVVMIKDKTDSENQARELAKLLQGIPSKVNLIPYNENSFFPQLKTPSPEKIEKYKQVLLSQGVFAMIRLNRGADIMGACGQLAGQSLGQNA